MSKWCCGVPPARPPPSETVKASITRHHSCIISITGICSGDDSATVRGVGVLIHPTLVLTTHSTIPSFSSIRDAKITLCRDVASFSYVERKFMPEIFFQTDAELDLTVVSCEPIAAGLDTLPLDTAKLSRRALRKNRTVFVMGCHTKDPEDVVILEGKLSSFEKADRLNSHLWFQTGEDVWMPGSAGFDEFGTFSFIVSRPPMLQGQGGGNAQNSGALGGLFSKRKPNQWGSSIQIIKNWVEPLWMANRNEVFGGPHPEAVFAPINRIIKRPSFREKATESKISVKDAAVTVAIRQATLHDVMDIDKHTAIPEISISQYRKKPAGTSRNMTPKNPRAQPRARTPPDNVTAIREWRAKREASNALRNNKGTNRVANKEKWVIKGQDVDDVSVQTELLLTEADVKLNRGATEDTAGEWQKGRCRERWSLPADGHALDFLRDDREETPWTDQRYNTGRHSRSERPSRTSSAGSTPPHQCRQVVSDGEEVEDDDATPARSGSSTRSLLRADSVYFKPTVSYMQKRNVNQRDAILARQATSNILPRWS